MSDVVDNLISKTCCPDTCGCELEEDGCTMLNAATEIKKLRNQLVSVKETTLRMVAGLFSESVHETWSREEIVSIIEDMIRLGKSNEPECRHEDYCLHPQCECAKTDD